MATKLTQYQVKQVHRFLKEFFEGDHYYLVVRAGPGAFHRFGDPAVTEAAAKEFQKVFEKIVKEGKTAGL